MSNLDLATAKRLLQDRGARRLFAKVLSPNDNSKNQIYLGGDFEALHMIPSGEPKASSSGSHRSPIFKAPVDLRWIDDSGQEFEAPASQVILYPQYPEVRMSGFLRGARWAPVGLLTSREPGRVILFGVTDSAAVLAIASSAGSKLANGIDELRERNRSGVFVDVEISGSTPSSDARSALLERLGQIARKGWIDSWRLSRDGERLPCNASNCVGATLESELGIVANGRSEPDFLGWEVKAATVTRLSRPRLRVITLMTPEPTGGEYRKLSVEEFVQKFGYKDKRGRENRFNFGGIHKAGRRHPTTKLSLIVSGFDAESDTITRADGELALVDDSGHVAASWSFSSMLAHWNRKHARAAYVPAVARTRDVRAYCYSDSPLLASGPDFLALLSAIAAGTVYYDPGIKLTYDSEGASTKTRSQWRIAGKHLPVLYRESEWVNDLT